MNLPRQCLSEFLGTFALVFAGCGAIVVNDVSGGVIGHLGIALSFGLVVLSLIYTLGEISGAHVNPAVTLGFWAAGLFPARRVLPFIVSQLCGALAASLVLHEMFPEHPNMGATQPHGAVWVSVALECLLTWWLMLVILAVSRGAREKGLVAGVVVGSVVALEALFAGPISGASMNPARSLAPAIVGEQFQSLWIYLVAPAVGAGLAALSHRILHKNTPSQR